ncbi:hypothetical protein K443DRAFT_130516 [Laccaria amethystina LaAM-08-1]|uniref:GDP/GTP exchange factor Sec2 N-terminal domain-containing protein n=1 Tax=Laccaria amethystina LaAM-08-1 TaxID=1095629 RepID=A0A0C9XU77_9AGAR|nr:hypothetical protein K443DRAFT_130516 [Laccaria amethystina LaAM-08-1]
MTGGISVELRKGLVIVQVVPNGFGEQRRTWKLPPHRVAPKRATHYDCQNLGQNTAIRFSPRVDVLESDHAILLLQLLVLFFHHLNSLPIVAAAFHLGFMLHFPSSLQANSQARPQSLNATQQKSSSEPLFLKIEDELHDARRVRTHGQEDDLKLALDMVISRVTELSTLLSDAYKSQAELEVQLNVAKSNLQLVISNNEMLEDALKRENSTQSRDVGWRRTSGRDDSRSALERSQSVDYAYTVETPSPPVSANTDNRFFKFRFSSSTAPPSRPNSSTRPGTSSSALSSPSMPSLPSHVKELEELTAELAKERAAKKTITDEKAALEAELESLSQALFEEANKMVATERIKRAETEEELKELRQEKEALRSALRLIEGENFTLRSSENVGFLEVENLVSRPRSHTRSSSEIAVKSRPESLDLEYTSLPPLPPSPSPYPEPISDTVPLSTSPSPLDEEDAQPTPRYQPYQPLEPSPWADVPSQSSSMSSTTTKPSLFATMFPTTR